MFENLRDIFEEFISDKPEEHRILINLDIRCDYTIENSRQKFSLYHIGNKERSVWFGFHGKHSKENFINYIETQYSQIV